MPAALLVTWLSVAASSIGLKVALVSVPPFTLAGARYLVAAGVLAVWWLRCERFRPHVEWDTIGLAMLSGALMIFVCQGGITWAVQYLQPGIAAVMASTVPLWVTLLSRVLFGAPVATATALGLVAGFGGVAFLASPSAGAGVPMFPALVVSCGALSWAIGSLVVARSSIGTRPMMVATVQMLTGGAMQLLAGLAAGELHAIDPTRLGAGAAAVFLLLLVVPSIVGYPVFSWLLGLPVSGRAWIASAVILGSVALMVTANARPTRSVASDRLMNPVRVDRDKPGD